MIASTNFRYLTGIALTACFLTAPHALAAQSAAIVQPKWPRVEITRAPFGNYLAARHASAERDAKAAASYYRAALRADPNNSDLLDRAFISVLTEGDINEAVRLAERVLKGKRTDHIARLVLGIRGIKQKQYGSARQNLAQSVLGPVTDLTAAMLTAWAQAGAGETKAAVQTIDRLAGAEWYALFKHLHAGMILDLAGRKEAAGKEFEAAYKLDDKALLVAQAYASFLSRRGKTVEALSIYEKLDKAMPRHPLVVDAMARLKRGEKLPLLADDAAAGAAEFLYGLGASLGRRGGAEDLGLVYLQLAVYLEPQHSLALLAIADLYEAMKKPQLALSAYERVPEQSPLRRNADIQMAIALDTLDRTDEAKSRLEKLIAARPNDLEAIMALGNILRARKQYADCVSVYDKGIATISGNERSDWVFYYFRGICNERTKKWPAAEADLKKALELFPDQPQVLNYLGYSWIDQGINLEEGMRMIRRSVEQRPDDGYIVDSLGWAYYRMGNYEEATKHLEKAVELRPDDPTINDHLGDAYWRIGRTLEASFQWSHARDLKPEPEELAKIEQKLRSGLPEETSTTADQSKKSGNGG